MKVEVQELERCKLLANCEANFFEISDKRAKVEEAFKKAPVPGFRPGKASVEALRMHYGKQIDDALKQALAEDAFQDFLNEKKVKPHGPPRFNSLFLDGGKFTCEFEVYTRPDFELMNWKNMEVPKPHEQQDAGEVAVKMMQELRERLGDAVPYGDDDFVQLGDNLIVTYEATLDGVKVDNLCATDEMLSVGKSNLPGFDTNLLGMSMGEVREFDYTAPEGGLPSLSGKSIHFKLTVVTGSKTVPCGLSDELAHKMGKKDLAELQEFVNNASFARVAQFNRTKVQEVISRKLVHDVVINVPSWMSVSEAQYLAQQSQLNWNDMSDSDRESFVKMAELNVKLALVLDKIREDCPEAGLSDQEVFEVIKQNVAQTANSKQNADEVMAQMSKTGYLQILFSRIRDEYTMDYVVKHVKLID